jgi:uncharacterized membrane protein YkvA (DUF1232 family)
MNVEAWKRRARQLSAQTYILYLAYRHVRTPWYAKVVAALVVGYVFSPLDPIPDFIPGVGLLDEMVVVPIGILIATKMIPRDVLEECRERAREVAEGEKPVLRKLGFQECGFVGNPVNRGSPSPIDKLFSPLGCCMPGKRGGLG